MAGLSYDHHRGQLIYGSNPIERRTFRALLKQILASGDSSDLRYGNEHCGKSRTSIGVAPVVTLK